MNFLESSLYLEHRTEMLASKFEYCLVNMNRFSFYHKFDIRMGRIVELLAQNTRKTAFPPGQVMLM